MKSTAILQAFLIYFIVYIFRLYLSSLYMNLVTTQHDLGCGLGYDLWNRANLS